LREKGVRPVRGGATGDLFCRVVVETPVNLTAAQKELVRKLEEALVHDRKKHNPREQTWLSGVKKFFENISRSV
jgi:molecular chaperone DnaJ